MCNSDSWLTKYRELIIQSKNAYLDTFNLKQGFSKKDYQALLGGEKYSILFDAKDNFDSNLFTGLEGSLVGGGTLVIDLPHKISPILINLCRQRETASKPELKLFNDILLPEMLKRLLKLAIESNQTAIVCQDEHFSFPEIASQQSSTSSAIEQQQKIVKSICRVSTGHAKRPLVLTAARGRGKSAALGLATKELIKKPDRKILVSAASFSNLNSFYKHLNISCNHQKQISLDNNSSVTYLSVDKIINDLPKANLLIIDEAAALPVQQLEVLAKHYNRIVFATTTEGYEGNGKGFDIRFRQKLIALMPQTQFSQMDLPIRWSKHDELENITYNTFLLKYPLVSIDATAPTENLQFQEIDKQTLRTNESVLIQVFSLLVNAHYQTRPSDLERLLSDQRLKIYGICDMSNQKHLHAICLVRIEGQLDIDTIKNLSQGKRENKGELLPQAIVLNYNLGSLAELKFARIMRIAVHPNLQNKGLGSRLISVLEKELCLQKFDFIGASFAVDSQVVNFWLKNQFAIFRFGSAKDSASGNFTCDVIKSLKEISSPATAKDFESLLKRFAQSIRYKIAHHLQELDNKTIFQTLRSVANKVSLDEYNTHEILSFSKGQKNLANVDWQIFEWYISWLLNNQKETYLDDRDGIIIDLVYRVLDWQTIREKHFLTGKKQILAQVRSELNKMLTNN